MAGNGERSLPFFRKKKELSIGNSIVKQLVFPSCPRLPRFINASVRKVAFQHLMDDGSLSFSRQPNSITERCRVADDGFPVSRVKPESELSFLF